MSNPLDPFGYVPGDPMEDVLSLQSYTEADGLLAEQTGVCCPSAASCVSSASGVIIKPIDPRPIEPAPWDPRIA
jgi:hypothetical protein